MDTPLPPDNNAKPQQVTPTFRVDPVTQQRLPEKPRRVRSGIRLATKEDPPVFGWLGTLFLQEFEGAFDAMGIEEGHMYARSGQTKAINIEAGAIAIRVQGRREGAYNLSIAVPILKEEDVERMTRAFVDQAIHGARVIAGEMMPETNELLNSLGIRLLPMLSECVISCSCEYEDPMCKHLRCAVLLLAQIFDKEPMLAFRLRGVETAELTEELRRLRTERAGGQRVTAPLPMNGIIPDEFPDTPIEDAIGNFWSCGPDIDTLETPIRPPEISHALLRRLGSSPFKDAKFPLVGLLATCYDAISAHALSEPDDEDGSDDED